MSIRRFVDDVEPSALSVTVEAPDPDARTLGPIRNLLEKTFADPQVTVGVETAESPEREALLQVTGEDGTALATSRLQDVSETLLLVNEDLYTTGARTLDRVSTPDAVLALDETTFTVRGKSKFLLIHLSRHIEALAAETDAGEIHTCFQELSRLGAEKGTERVYERLTSGSLDVHVYGIDDLDGPLGLPARVHGRELGELGRSWFVVHDGAGNEDRKAALVAVQCGPATFDGYWTFDPARVDEVLGYLRETYLGEGSD
jgi:DICT domain-containing protein